MSFDWMDTKLCAAIAAGRLKAYEAFCAADAASAWRGCLR